MSVNLELTSISDSHVLRPHRGVVGDPLCAYEVERDRVGFLSVGKLHVLLVCEDQLPD